jgi:hypothetical protein
VESFLPKHPSVIAETMRKVEDAIAEVKVLQNMNDQATMYQEMETQELHRKFKVKNQWFKE